MRSVGIDEAKTQLSKLVDEAAGGATITITKHGATIAELRAATIRAGRGRSPTEAAALMDAWIAYRGKLNITLVRGSVDSGVDRRMQTIAESGR